ncbi:hypothetical protein TSAR_007187 [Trichomalopsis sarcophagae]|uniref:Uncharacterized protein n=1 Tax=Trichomalopsis sarcophagae TaxID=543379 RepID=A0A232FIS5_9HYME|nr:hypothetical protein TSAR_007187 [Trichomalopsis sarcophagae]
MKEIGNCLYEIYFHLQQTSRA